MQATAVAPDAPDAALVEALRARDEDAYLELVRRHTPLMLRVARSYVGRRDVAEDVVQDTWVAVLRAIDGFEGRSTFKTWLMRILVNTARTRRLREGRAVCWSSGPEDAGLWDAAARAAGFAEPPGPERCALGGEVMAAVRAALDELPERQRIVVVLRDVEGWSSDEVRHALRLSIGNQRVLLHRGRARLRELLAAFTDLDGTLEEPELAGAGHRVGA
jgi:RNA polymerase sigma-70 factor, ECF subfamily